MRGIWPAILLAWIAGFVDALGYLALAKVFTAHMSGNAAAVGAQLGSGNWHEAMVRGLAIPAFILGIAIGTATEALVRRWVASKLAIAFALEISLLVCFMAIEPGAGGRSPNPGSLGYFVRVWLLTLAMGIQSATLRHAGGMRVRTTYVSGMLTNMTESGVMYLMQLWGGQNDRQSPGASTDSAPLGPHAINFGLIFLSFLIGGICGGYAQVSWGSLALVAPCAGLLFLVVKDLSAPRQRR